MSEKSKPLSKSSQLLLGTLLGLTLLFVLGACAIWVISEIRAERQQLALESQNNHAAQVMAIPVDNNNDEAFKIEESRPVNVLSQVFVNIYSQPSGAQIYYNGIRIGQTPLENASFEAKSEEAEWIVALEGYDPERFMQNTAQGFRKDLELQETPPTPAVTNKPKSSKTKIKTKNTKIVLPD